MSNTVTIKGNNQNFSGRLILTNYGKARILQRIAQDSAFTGFNFTDIALGDKLNNNYISNIKIMGNETLRFEISDENVYQNKNMVTIETNLNLEGEVIMQEVGLFETIDGSRKLFAYASGFSMVKKESISYTLIIDLSLSLTFENEHYSRYDVMVDDAEYALAPDMNRLFVTLTESQMDLERCIEINSRELSYNKAQAFMLEQQNVSNVLHNILLFGRYEKTIARLGINNLTDCFYYPIENATNYTIKNLKDEISDKYEDVNHIRYTLVTPFGDRKYFVDPDGNTYLYETKDGMEGFYRSPNMFVILTPVPHSIMSVNGSLQLCNRDNIDLSTTASIVYTAKLNTIKKDNRIVIGKINPDEDEYYFDFRVIYDKDRNENGLQFTIYSYDYKKAKNRTYTDEHKLVGHYRIKYFPNDEERTTIATNETMFAFVYNGDIDNPEVKMYINTTPVNNSVEEKVLRYAFTYTDGSGEHTIYANRDKIPSKLYNSDGTAYEGEDFIIADNVVYYIVGGLYHEASYTPRENIVVYVDRFIVDNFNYMGPCEEFKERCTLRNYSQTKAADTYTKPMYYLMPEVENSSILVFNKELDEEDILYLSLISKS